MNFDDIWNAEPPKPVMKQPSWFDRAVGHLQNHFWYGPLAFWTAVFDKRARQ